MQKLFNSQYIANLKNLQIWKMFKLFFCSTFEFFRIFKNVQISKNV
jgi:hypothetical protein